MITLAVDTPSGALYLSCTLTLEAWTLSRVAKEGSSSGGVGEMARIAVAGMILRIPTMTRPMTFPGPANPMSNPHTVDTLQDSKRPACAFFSCPSVARVCWVQ